MLPGQFTQLPLSIGFNFLCFFFTPWLVLLHAVLQSSSYTPSFSHHTPLLVIEQDSEANVDKKATVEANTWTLIAGFQRTSNDIFIQCVIQKMQKENKTFSCPLLWPLAVTAVSHLRYALSTKATSYRSEKCDTVWDCKKYTKYL